jgi:hypothetical protein
MADLDSRSTNDGASVNSEHAGAPPESRPTGSAEGNHAPPTAASGPAPSPQAASSAADDRSGLDRAEELVDSFAEKVSSLTSSWGRKFLRLGSRARESVQDFWAEVQDFRQGKKP